MKMTRTWDQSKAEIRSVIEKNATKPCGDNHRQINFEEVVRDGIRCVRGACNSCGIVVLLPVAYEEKVP